MEIEKKKKLAEMLDGENIAPVEFIFSKDFYETADLVKAWLSDEGYEDFVVNESEVAFIVKAEKDLEVQAIKTSSIQREDGITVIVKEYDFSDLEENTIEEIKGLRKSEGESEAVEAETEVESVEETKVTEGGEEAKLEEAKPEEAKLEEAKLEEIEEQKEEPEIKEEGEDVKDTEAVEAGEEGAEDKGDIQEEVEEQKEDSKPVLLCRGKNILEITKGIKKSLDYLTSVKEVKKEYSDSLGAYFGAETIEEALAIGGYDGGFPGMDEVLDTLEEFIKAALQRGDLEASREAFTVAADYINDLKGIFDNYADSETLAMFTERMMSSESKEEEIAKSLETEPLNNDLLKEIHKELLVLNSSNDIKKSNDEDTVAKITELQESYSKDFTNLGDKLDAISNSFEEFVSIEQTRVKSSLPRAESVTNSGGNEEGSSYRRMLKDI